MVKRTINRNDWSGEKGTYSYTKNTINFGNGYKFVLKHRQDKRYNLKWIDVYEYKKNGRYQKGEEEFNVQKWSNESGDWSSSKYGVEREGKNPYDVIAEMFWNLY